MNIKEYWKEEMDGNNEAFFTLPEYDYVSGLWIEYDEDNDIYIAMGGESWNKTKYDGGTDINVVVADFTNAWRKKVEDVFKWYKESEGDLELYRDDDYDFYTILIEESEKYGVRIEEKFDPYRGYYIVDVA